MGRNYDGLVNILSNFHPEFDSDELTKENIYKRLYPGKKFKESVINTVLSGLNQLCDEFFVNQDFRNDQQRDVRLLRQYCKRGYKPKADKIVSRLEKFIERPAVNILEYFKRMELLDAMDIYYTSHDKRSVRHQHLIRSLLNLDYYFIIQSLIFKKELSSGNLYAENKPDDTLPLKIYNEINFDKLIELIEKEDPENSLLLSIYFLIVKTYSDKFDDINYNKLRELVTVNLKVFDFDTCKYLLLNLQLINTMRLNEGRKEYEKEWYEISKILIEGKFYDRDENWFRASHFRSIVKTGISMGDIEYIELFIKNFTERLEPNLRAPLKHFAQANVLFEKKMYNESLDNILRAELNNTLYKIDARRLTAKIYYETDSIENLQSYLDAFSHFLKNIRTIDKTIINRNKRFIKHLKKLIRIKDSARDQYELDLLKNSILNENVSEKNWLLNKLAEFI
ncbi:MAG: hypothetical protein IPM96_09860 [Ignavibacteria bacterium]|nr:hypothetical protein [Ignavibacteria bacterium]